MKRILIADDEPDMQDLLKQRLEFNHYEVVGASNGEEVLKACEESAIDLVLLDIAMPRLDGYETCKRLKSNEKTKDIPVFFLTGKDLAPDGIIERCQELDACGYFPKPYDVKELLRKIAEVI
ncbi:MAG: response regulator [Candidatus Omnitrophica bacterium]|nr:response regulator [Candidatus Omnitrophota bacterium]